MEEKIEIIKILNKLMKRRNKRNLEKMNLEQLNKVYFETIEFWNKNYTIQEVPNESTR